MKNSLLILTLLLSLFGYSQISTFPYTQTFSNTVPPNFTTTSGWSLTNNNNARTGTYSARLSPAINNNTNYLYIAVSVKEDYTYTLSLWVKKVCGIRIITNETPDLTSVLFTQDNTINGCNGNGWKEVVLTYKPNYTGVMYFEILAYAISEDKIYLDDLMITELAPISLPITLLYFKGKIVDGYNKLYWASATEHNNDYYTVEKTTDGINFYEIGRINGFAYSSHVMYYELYDTMIFDEISYYRLKQTDYNGETVTYDLIAIDNRLKSAPSLIKVTNLLGKEVNLDDTKPNEILFFHYNDGTVIKRFY